MNRYLAFLLLALMIGCSHSGNSSSTSGPNPESVDNTPPTPDPLGQFTPVREDADAVNRAIECSFSMQFHIDERLAPGQEFESSEKFSIKEGGFESYGPVRYVIESVDRAGGVVIRKKFFNFPQGEIWIRESCKFPTNQLGSECTTIDASIPVENQNSRTVSMKSCIVVRADSTALKQEVGTYTFAADGHSVQAYRTTRHEEGEFQCDGKPAGTGTHDEVEIYSADVPEFAMPVCARATNVFKYSVFRDINGEIIAAWKHEVSKSPQ